MIPLLLSSMITLLGFTSNAYGQCLSDSGLNDFFIPEGETQIPLEGSCCQADVCGLGCPEDVDAPAAGKS